MIRLVLILSCAALVGYFTFVPPHEARSQTDTIIKAPPGSGISPSIDTLELIRQANEASAREAKEQLEHIQRLAKETDQINLETKRELDKLKKKFRTTDTVLVDSSQYASRAGDDSCTVTICPSATADSCKERTWFGKFFVLLGECKLIKKFKR